MAAKNKKNPLKFIERLLATDTEFAESYLKENGIDPNVTGRDGTAFVQQLLETQRRSLALKRKEKQIRWTHDSVMRLLKENKSGDPITIIKEKCKHIVLDAFSKGWAGPPFDVVQLAKLLGIQILPFELVTDARISSNNNQFKIEYNPHQSAARINFSIAHEIGHTLFSDCAEMIRYRQSRLEDESWQLEFLCNVAASELLLPYAEFANEANNIDLNITSVIGLARQYNASVESVFLRLCEVLEKPCTTAIASFNTEGMLEIEYSKSSPLSTLEMPRGEVVPTTSNVYDCKKTGWTSHEVEEWEIFSGLKYRVYGVGLSPIKRQSTPRVGILFVPVVYDTTGARSIYIVNGDATVPRGKDIRIIGQVINSSGGMGFGFGRAIAEKYPIAKLAVSRWKSKKDEFTLGSTQLVEIDKHLYIFQMLAQEGIKEKRGIIPLRYSALQACLEQLYFASRDMNASVHIPAIGAGQAGGDWNIIKGMIYDELVRKGIDVTIYLLPGSNMAPKQSRTLTLYKGNEE